MNYPKEIWVDTDLVGNDEPIEGWEKYYKADSFNENDIKTFASEIREKINNRRRKVGFEDLNIDDSVYDMIVNKMKKEGWVKTV